MYTSYAAIKHFIKETEHQIDLAMLRRQILIGGEIKFSMFAIFSPITKYIIVGGYYCVRFFVVGDGMSSEIFYFFKF